MRLGLHIGYWGLGLSSAEQLELVQEAERLGYDSVWTAEAYGSDAVTILAWLAAQTDRIRLGSAILQMPGRSAAMTAMTAATLDQLSDGRVLLGIGTSGPQVAEGWHGQRFGTSCSARASTSRSCGWRCGASASSIDGETLELPLPDGPGKALKLTIAPVQERIPIYIAAIGPEEHDAHRRDRRRLAPDDLLARARGRVPPAARGGLRARRRRQVVRATSTSRRPCNVNVGDDRDGGARRDAPLPRALRRRDGLAQAELLQRARAALRLRGRRAQGPGPLPRGPARTRPPPRCPPS